MIIFPITTRRKFLKNRSIALIIRIKLTQSFRGTFMSLNRRVAFYEGYV